MPPIANSELIQKRYNRIAPVYDAMEGIIEILFFSNWRKLIWQKVTGQNILELGAGTGKNFPYYPAEKSITAIDFSTRMLSRARKKANQHHLNVDIQQMDAQALEFPDNSFDTIIATFVFCSVPDPLLGLQEAFRVCKPGGQILLLEHVLSSKPLLAMIMNRLNPLISRLMGANINRTTVATVQLSEFTNLQVENISSDIIKLIQAYKTT